jgi:YVTN family beta-propeller protein
MKMQIHNYLFGSSAGKRVLLAAAALMLLSAGARAQFVSTVISSNLFEPNSVATDANGNAYITDSINNRIVKFNPDTGVSSTFVGFPGYSGDNGGPGIDARFLNPMGIVAARGGLVVVDQGNQLIRFVGFNEIVSDTPIAGVAGETGTNNGPGATAKFNFPSGIAADPAGNLYVADQGNNTIRVIDTNNNVSNLVTSGGYQFLQPTGVAVDNNGNVWVSDTGNQVIVMISNHTVAQVIGTSGVSGYDDFTPLFSLPTGLLWATNGNYLLVADTGNDVIRSITYTNYFGNNTYQVQTVVGIPGTAGTVDQPPLIAEFDAPVGLGVDPFDSGYYVVDRIADTGIGTLGGTGTLRVYQTTLPLPAPAAPVFGYVVFTPPGPGAPSVTEFIAANQAVFNNSAIVAIETDTNSQSFITYGPTGSSIPAPNPKTGFTPNSYGGNGQTTAAPSILSPLPDLTVYAVTEGPTGKLSPTVSARFQWVAANPVITGINAANIQLTDGTAGAVMYYTVDGNTPTNGAPDAFGPLQNGDTLSLIITSNTTLSVRAFTNNYAPSGVSTLNLYYSNYVANTVSFNTNSSKAGSGATLVIPVFATLAQSNVALQSIQYRAEVTPTGGNNNSVSPLADLSFTPFDYFVLPGVSPLPLPVIFEYETYNIGSAEGLSIFNYTNSAMKVTGVGPVGLIEIPMPDTVAYGQTYSVAIINPSGTSDDNQANLGLVGFTNTVTITDPIYFAGDSSPAGGYNAGEFGDGQLNNADVNNAMYASVGIREPFAFSDAYDDMDVYPPDNGDGLITLLDWQTTLNRALGLDTNNWIRFRTNGGVIMHQQVAWTPGGEPIPLTDATPRHPVSKTSGTPKPPGQVWFTQAALGAGTQVNMTPGSTCSIPVFVNISSGSTLSGLQFRAILSGVDGAPAPGIISFTPATGVPTPSILPGLSESDIACFWGVGSFPSNLKGSNYLGAITFQVPSNAQTGQSYAVHFVGVDGAPNMTTLYQLESFPGFAWVKSPALQPPQITSDEWRTTFFGSPTNSLAADNVDADGDGMPNWQEYLAGTNPTDAASKFQFGASSLNPTGVKGVALSWLTAPGKTYTLLSSPAISGSNWTAINTNVGDGYNYQFIQTNYNGASFYKMTVNQY